MAKIDFNSRNIGSKIHDDGEFMIPENVISDPALGVPERFGINRFEDPPLVYDRFPGMTDAEVTTELDRQWNEQDWPYRVAQYYEKCDQVNQEAGARIENSAWRLERALDRASGDYTDADVVAELAKKEDIRVKSSEVTAKLKTDLLNRVHPDEWPSPTVWASEHTRYSNDPEVARAFGDGPTGGMSPEQYVTYAETSEGITNPGRKDS